MNKKSEITLFRSNISTGIKGGKKSIDRENGIIHDYSVITKGEALGHEVIVDDTTLDQVIELGSKSKLGTKSRFGHPTMCSEALGTFLGRSKNFYRDGDSVRADLIFDKTAFNTPNGDLANYVMDLAESDPKSFGTSIVFDGERVYQLEDDGTRKKDEEGNELMPLCRVKKLWASDVVDDPAANDGGMFGQTSFFSPNIKLSAEATMFLDKLLQQPEAVEKVIGFLKRYGSLREESDGSKHQPTKQEVEEMEFDFAKLTVDHIKLNRPDLMLVIKDQYAAEALEAVGKEKEKFSTDALKAERQRCESILAEAQGFEVKGIDAVALECIKDGSTADKALTRFQALKLEDLKKNKPASAGPGAEHSEGVPEGLSGVDLWKWEFAHVPDINKQFSSEKTYIAFKKADARGAVKILKRK